jgi:repressor LexA
VHEPLTEKQAAVLDFLRRRADRGEPPPTNQEICDEFRWSSTRAARDHLQRLERKGYVELSGRGHRRVRLRDESTPVARVPLVGRIVAGMPVESLQNLEGHVPVPAEWIGGGTCFAVRVKGDSMRDAGILEGDLVVARKQPTAENGDVVVAILNGESTLKRLRRHGRGTTLVAENRRYRSLPVRTESAEVQGVVVGLMRAFRPTRGWAYHRIARPSPAPPSHEGRRHADRP